MTLVASITGAICFNLGSSEKMKHARKMLLIGAVALCLPAGPARASVEDPLTSDACIALASDGHGTTVRAQFVPAGAAVQIGSDKIVGYLPAHCRVTGTLGPARNSRIGFEL